MTPDNKNLFASEAYYQQSMENPVTTECDLLNGSWTIDLGKPKEEAAVPDTTEESTIHA